MVYLVVVSVFYGDSLLWHFVVLVVFGWQDVVW